MDTSRAALLLQTQAAALESLCAKLPPELTRWKPATGGWDIHTVLCHLLDEERGDFRARIRQTFDTPTQPWTPIDPEGWVSAHGYVAWNYAETLQSFLHERENSIAWLREQTGEKWDRAHEHPKLGTIRARDLLAAWLDHDRLHLRQILRLLHQSSSTVVPDGRTDYAGAW